MMMIAFTIFDFILCSPQVETQFTGKHTLISLVHPCHVDTMVVRENKVSNLLPACRWWVSAVQLVEAGHRALPDSDHLSPPWRWRWRGMVVQGCRSLLQSFSSFFRNWCRWSKFFPQKLFSSPGIASQGWRGFLLLLCRRGSCLPPGVQGEGEVGPNLQGEGEGRRLASQHLAKVQTLGRKKSIFIQYHISGGGTMISKDESIVMENIVTILFDYYNIRRKNSNHPVWSPSFTTKRTCSERRRRHTSGHITESIDLNQ